jgi:hypothetical protein
MCCQTRTLLAKVLGNDQASALLARAVHEDVQLPLSNDVDLSALGLISVDEESIGIWIDPIGKLPLFCQVELPLTVQQLLVFYRFVSTSERV